MKIDYIESLSEAYIIDHQIADMNSNDLSLHFHEMLKEIREEQPELYQEVYESNRYDQARIFKTYFDLQFMNLDEVIKSSEDLENLEEGFSVTIPIGLKVLGYIGAALLTVMPQTGPFIRKALSIVSVTAAKLIKWAGSSMVGTSKSWILGFAVIEKNANECYKLCDTDPSKLTIWNVFGALLKKDSVPDSYQGKNKTICLIECYVTYIREVCKIHATAYFNCLKNNNTLKDMPMYQDFNRFQTFILTAAIDSQCDEIFNLFKGSVALYEECVNNFYKDSRVKAQYLQLLVDEVFKTQKSVQQKSGPIKPQEIINRQVYTQKPRERFEKRG